MVNEVRKPAAFLDRDGVLIRDTGYVYRPEDLEILPGVFEALKLLHDKGFLLIVISNQAGVARGYFPIEAVHTFHKAMQDRIEEELGFRLDGIYFCPHHPMGEVMEYSMNCKCRKPGTALLEEAGQAFPIDWDRSIMVGDKDSDVECGQRAGLISLLVESDQYASEGGNPHARVRDLLEAAQWTLKHMPDQPPVL